MAKKKAVFGFPVELNKVKAKPIKSTKKPDKKSKLIRDREARRRREICESRAKKKAGSSFEVEMANLKQRLDSIGSGVVFRDDELEHRRIESWVKRRKGILKLMEECRHKYNKP